MQLLSKFLDYITKKSLINNGEKLMLAVSGGPDSLTMLDLFMRIKNRFNLHLSVFHLNHQFREEAATEAEFVEKVCDKYGVESIIRTYDVPSYIKKEGLSPEEAARSIRFKFLCEETKRLKIDRVALAHNRDDLVETVLLNMIRGCGLKGLTGIDPRSEWGPLILIHPLLSIYRTEIEQYCQERGLNPRRDPTNQQPIYTRNKIRHKIIPYIEKQINPGFKKVMARMVSIVSEEEQYLQNRADQFINKALISEEGDRVVLKVSILKKIAGVIRRRVLQDSIYKLKEPALDIYSDHIKEINKLLFESKTGSKLDLPGDIKVKKSYDHLIIKRGSYEVVNDYECQVRVPGITELPGSKLIKTSISKKYKNWLKEARKQGVCLSDLNKINLPLKVRNRREGDWFQPLGMQGKKKLKDLFIDEKIPRKTREKTPIIVDDKDNIIWVAGLRMDERFKIGDETVKILKIKVEQKGDTNE